MKLPEPLDELSPDEQNILQQYLEQVRFAAGTRLFEEGSPGDGCYIIDEGEVRLEVQRPEVDSDGVLGFLGEGTILGELSLLDRLPRSAGAYSHTDVAARRLSAAGVERLMNDHPRIGLQVFRALGRDAARKLRATTHKLAEFALTDVDPEVDQMVSRAQAALEAFAPWTDEQVDGVLKVVAETMVAQAEDLARDTVKETKIGNVPDKTTKNQVASMGIYRSLVGRPGRGTLGAPGDRKVVEIASPAGVVFALIPMTNPVATAVFKTLIALKGGNAIILSFHRAALGVGNRTGELIRDAIERAGAPPDLLQWIRQRSSRRKTAMYLSHPGVSLILATGGAGMVRAAYSSGTPALGVGPANTPCLVCADADPDAAARAIVTSKSFDNGLICGAEHNLVVDRPMRDALVQALERSGAAVLTPDETAEVAKVAVDPASGEWRPQVIGQAAQAIAAYVGITRPHAIRVLVVPTEDASPGKPFAGEKLFPLLSLFTVDGPDEGFALCRRLLHLHGIGHSAVIHTRDEAVAERFGREMPAGRILVNSPCAQGVVGMTSGLEPSFTLGCGTFGKNSTTDNVGYRHLLNVKRFAYYLEPTGAQGA